MFYVLGSADSTYKCFHAHKLTYEKRKIKNGYGCILDGDMKLIKKSDGKRSFPDEENLHFLFSNDCPEKFLTKVYLDNNPNTTIQYYHDNENPHYLFQAIIDNSELSDKNAIFEACWKYFVDTDNGKKYLEELTKFLLNLVLKFSPDL